MATELTDPFDEMMRRVEQDGEPQTLTRFGYPVAVIVPYAEYERLRALAPVQPVPEV